MKSPKPISFTFHFEGEAIDGEDIADGIASASINISPMHLAAVIYQQMTDPTDTGTFFKDFYMALTELMLGQIEPIQFPPVPSKDIN